MRVNLEPTRTLLRAAFNPRVDFVAHSVACRHAPDLFAVPADGLSAISRANRASRPTRRGSYPTYCQEDRVDQRQRGCSSSQGLCGRVIVSPSFLATVEKLRTAKSIDQAIAIQSDFATRTVDAYFHELSRIGSIYAQLFKSSYEGSGHHARS